MLPYIFFSLEAENVGKCLQWVCADQKIAIYIYKFPQQFVTCLQGAFSAITETWPHTRSVINGHVTRHHHLLWRHTRHHPRNITSDVIIRLTRRHARRQPSKVTSHVISHLPWRHTRHQPSTVTPHDISHLPWRHARHQPPKVTSHVMSHQAWRPTQSARQRDAAPCQLHQSVNPEGQC